jgi:hypothetical protein
MYFKAVDGGVQIVIIASGRDSNTIGKIMTGKSVGTAFYFEPKSLEESLSSRSFLSNTTDDVIDNDDELEHTNIEEIAKEVRFEYQDLIKLDDSVRNAIILDIADSIGNRKDDIL